MFRAAILGAAAAVVGVILFAYLGGVFFGMHAPFDDKTAYGLQGGSNALSLLLLVALFGFGLPVLVVAAAGALAGVVVRLIYRAATSRAQKI
jgi:hypothetical protein